ncbi:hypothetical protein PHMEG_00040115, partial [Phytophthora megakarya]
MCALRAVQTAIALRKFPPLLSLPENQGRVLLSEWFTVPSFTWSPEVLTGSGKPICVIEGCSCTPQVKEYIQRTVHDIDHQTTIYYARYICQVDDRYLASSKEVLLAFPSILTYKSGISMELFDLVYDGMLTTKGVSGAGSNVTRRRQKRYYSLLARAANFIEKRKRVDHQYHLPLFPSVDQFMTEHACLDNEAIQKVWLQQTSICSKLVEAHMASARCEKVIRADHSQKFCSKLKVFGADGSKEQDAEVRMLLLVQNEIGQVMARCLTCSENHEETRAILQPIVDKFSKDPGAERVFVCDHANSMRNLVNSVFGDGVTVKQDPFHVIQRMTEKVSDRDKKKWLAKSLSEASYD